MPCEAYIIKRFNPSSRRIIDQANTIIEEYKAGGFRMTLRQVYYQFIARDLFTKDRFFIKKGEKWIKDPKGGPNAYPNYKLLGNLISEGRMAGLIDWEAIEDRGRNLYSVPTWDSPADIISSSYHSYAVDRWKGQKYYIECWIEKDALTGLIQNVCDEYQVPWFSTRGYCGQSEMWEAATRRFDRKEADGRTVLVFHLGDHDPSGLDMTRDMQWRLQLFGSEAQVRRLALNESQIEEYNPPPNPTKTSDNRAKDYIEKFGESCWELDALAPDVLHKLIEDSILQYLDQDKYADRMSVERKGREDLRLVSKHWDKVVRYTSKLK